MNIFPPIDMTRVLLAVVSLCVGLFACICAILGLTGII